MNLPAHAPQKLLASSVRLTAIADQLSSEGKSFIAEQLKDISDDLLSIGSSAIKPIGPIQTKAGIGTQIDQSA